MARESRVWMSELLLPLMTEHVTNISRHGGLEALLRASQQRQIGYLLIHHVKFFRLKHTLSSLLTESFHFHMRNKHGELFSATQDEAGKMKPMPHTTPVHPCRQTTYTRSLQVCPHVRQGEEGEQEDKSGPIRTGRHCTTYT
jgi:hypothetical protein